MTNLILFVIVFAAAVMLSNKFKINFGIICMLAAFVLGGWYGGVSATAIINYFPVKLVFTILTASMFFAYVRDVGFFQGIIDRVLWAFKDKVYLMPVAFWIAQYIISSLGGSTPGNLMLSPLFFAFAAASGMKLVVVPAFLYASCIGSSLYPWTFGGVAFRGVMATGIGDELASTALNSAAVIMTIVAVIFSVIVYFVCGCHKLGKNGMGDFQVKKPEPFTKEQKTAMYIVIAIFALLIIPTVLRAYVGGVFGKVLSWLAANVAIEQLSLIGIVLFNILKLGNSQRVMTTLTPWGMIVTGAGACMLINCATSLGIIDLVSAWAASSVPAYWVYLVICIAGGLLCFVSAGMTVIPLLAPIIASLASTGTITVVGMACALYCGTLAAGMSPVSTGGMLAGMGASPEQREKVWSKQWMASALYLATYCLLCVLNFWPICANLFGWA